MNESFYLDSVEFYNFVRPTPPSVDIRDVKPSDSVLLVNFSCPQGSTSLGNVRSDSLSRSVT